MALDLTPEMRQIGGWFQAELKQYLRKQRDLLGARFQPVTIETAKNRQRASNRIQGQARAKGVKGRIKGTRGVLSTKSSGVGGLDFKRLLYTSRFHDGAYQFEPRKDEVRVFTNPTQYPGEDVTYRDIVNFNNAGSSRVNRNIINPPKIFPVTDAEVQKMAAYKRAVNLVSKRGEAKLIKPRAKKLITVLLG